MWSDLMWFHDLGNGCETLWIAIQKGCQLAVCPAVGWSLRRRWLDSPVIKSFSFAADHPSLPRGMKGQMQYDVIYIYIYLFILLYHVISFLRVRECNLGPTWARGWFEKNLHASSPILLLEIPHCARPRKTLIFEFAMISFHKVHSYETNCKTPSMQYRTRAI